MTCPLLDSQSTQGEARLPRSLTPNTSTTITVTHHRVRAGLLPTAAAAGTRGRRLLRDGSWYGKLKAPSADIEDTQAVSCDLNCCCIMNNCPIFRCARRTSHAVVSGRVCFTLLSADTLDVLVYGHDCLTLWPVVVLRSAAGMTVLRYGRWKSYALVSWHDCLTQLSADTTVLRCGR